jgi:hypothetical protein
MGIAVQQIEQMFWFATAYLSHKDPQFLERTVASYIERIEEAADETGVLDDALVEELKDLEEALLDDPSTSQAFSEFLQAEVQRTIDEMSTTQFAELMDLADMVFKKIPGGIMKYDMAGNKKPEDIRTWSKRRYSSKDNSGGGAPEMGGGTSFDRFAAALNHPKWPPEK